MGLTIEQQRERIRQKNRLIENLKSKNINKKGIIRNQGIFNLSNLNEAIDIAEYNRNRLIREATKEEKLFCEFLSNHKVDYRFQYPYYIKDHFYIMDFYIPRLRLDIELDGYYHFTKKGKKHDKNRDNEIKDQGMKILRIINGKFKNFSEIYSILKSYHVIT